MRGRFDAVERGKERVTDACFCLLWQKRAGQSGAGAEADFHAPAEEQKTDPVGSGFYLCLAGLIPIMCRDLQGVTGSAGYAHISAPFLVGPGRLT